MTTQRSELVALFTDYEKTFAPLDGPAMRLTITADVAFIAIGKLTEGVGTHTFTADDAHTIGIDVELLYATLGTMIQRDDRFARDRLADGDIPADHPSVVGVPVTRVAAATRIRA